MIFIQAARRSSRSGLCCYPVVDRFSLAVVFSVKFALPYDLLLNRIRNSSEPTLICQVTLFRLEERGLEPLTYALQRHRSPN